MNDMSLNTYIKLLVEFEEKVESHLNKKYKSFIRKIINWDALAKNVNQDRIKLSKELIVFQLGLEAKSNKAVEISLTYLVVLFILVRKCFSINLWTSTCPIIVSASLLRKQVSRKYREYSRNRKSDTCSFLL